MGKFSKMKDPLGLLSVLSVLMLRGLGYCEQLSAEECRSLGFGSALSCSSCKELSQFKLNDLVDNCKQCCQSDEDEEDNKLLLPFAELEVCS